MDLWPGDGFTLNVILRNAVTKNDMKPDTFKAKLWETGGYQDRGCLNLFTKVRYTFENSIIKIMTGKIDDIIEKPGGGFIGTNGVPAGFAKWLLEARRELVFRSPHAWIIAVLFGLFAYMYYSVLTSSYDICIILFYFPMYYAAIVFRRKGVVITGIIFLGLVLGHVVFFTQEPVAVLRTVIFAAFALIISGFIATFLNYLEHQIEAFQEIISLNVRLNDYIERVQRAQQQLIQAAKLSSIGQLAAAVAHELNNPLAGVLVYTKLMKEKLGKETVDREQLQKNLDKVETAIDYCTGIIRGLLDFARQTEPHLVPVTVHRAVDKAMALVGHQAKMKRIEVVRSDQEALPLVRADFNQIVQVVVNLIVNAIQAMTEECDLSIRTYEEEGSVKISVRDSGCGISEEHMDKLFTPFFTTREEVKGVGLGLAVSYGIIERHGGTIEVDSREGEGSVFRVVLPALPDNPETAPAGG